MRAPKRPRSRGRDAALPPFGVYYGWPSLVNGAAGDLETAAATFTPFPVLVFGEGNVLPGADPAAADLLPEVAARGVHCYGYIDLGAAPHSRNWDDTQLARHIDRWHTLGVRGVFFDCAGRDYGVWPARFADAVHSVHARGLHVIANAWNPHDVLAGASQLGAGDGYVGENDICAGGRFRPRRQYADKLAAAGAYRDARGVSVYLTETVPRGAEGGPVLRRLRAALDGYAVDGLQVTDPAYSAQDNLLRLPPTWEYPDAASRSHGE
jgi:hypothetical protein